ncbi:uncharacterized protein LAESUDRAFT_721252 [Laetiporus sulphureus 93-53]|uniref:Protein kinase domain-containing protein n=1 Tax=Laetiporus sulphureus 93-53 TaxID=1314785 RepID=A0A165GV98_9APHY|nr:uncharacterized protein LAESUDRAFT_721252 [Laetiporus sulphureus 93-53]KZT10865.1 hypothetical protein LAESUDRAFT_721252 [Laetiporus sulphureus 93-53]
MCEPSTIDNTDAETPDPPTPIRSHNEGELLPEEHFWRDHYQWLEECGYRLRPRYKPGWIPSWKSSHKEYWRCEDGHAIMVPHILDATRVSSGEMVVLKRILISEHPHEIEINQYFSAEPLASDPRNHCAPLYEVLQVTDQEGMMILVTPLLRRYDSPLLDTVGEAVEFFRQIFEGLQFMHQHHVAHRDCMNQNIMMDPHPLFPDMYHPRVIDWSRDLDHPARHYSRTARPTRYYFIDFGLSRKYRPDDGPPREPPIHGGDKSVPEFKESNEPCDPFPTDVYYIGNMIREDFLQRSHGVEVMQALVDEMVQDDPVKRPNMDEVVARFDAIRTSLSSSKLRSRLVYRDESKVKRVFKGVKHALGTVGSIASPRSPVHTP